MHSDKTSQGLLTDWLQELVLQLTSTLPIYKELCESKRPNRKKIKQVRAGLLNIHTALTVIKKYLKDQDNLVPLQSPEEARKRIANFVDIVSFSLSEPLEQVSYHGIGSSEQYANYFLAEDNASIRTLKWNCFISPSRSSDVGYFEGEPRTNRLAVLEDRFSKFKTWAQKVKRIALPSLDKERELELKLEIRRQIKAELNSNLSDGRLVAAFELYGSARQAADRLSSETGTKVTKDKVLRAVNREGGVEAIRARHRETCSEDSIRGEGLSQRRARRRKT